MRPLRLEAGAADWMQLARPYGRPSARMPPRRRDRASPSVGTRSARPERSALADATRATGQNRRHDGCSVPIIDRSEQRRAVRRPMRASILITEPAECRQAPEPVGRCSPPRAKGRYGLDGRAMVLTVGCPPAVRAGLGRSAGIRIQSTNVERFGHAPYARLRRPRIGLGCCESPTWSPSLADCSTSTLASCATSKETARRTEAFTPMSPESSSPWATAQRT